MSTEPGESRGAAPVSTPAVRSASPLVAMHETTLREKLGKIEALFAGATKEGKRDAAVRALVNSRRRKPRE